MKLQHIFTFFVLLTLPAISKAQESSLPEVMDVEKIRFDGKFTRYFSLGEFEQIFTKPDSSIRLISLQPCSYIFENADGSKDAEDEYWYKDGSRFERSQKRLAVDEFRFTKYHFILYDDIRLDSTTSINELAEHFPHAVRTIRDMDLDNEGTLQVITLREDDQNIADGHIRIILKDGRLYAIRWWFPC